MGIEAVTKTLSDETGKTGLPAETKATGTRLRTWIAWTAAGGSAAWVVSRALGLDAVPGLDRIAVPFLALTPYAAAGALLSVLTAALLRRWYATLTATAAALALGVTLQPPPTADAPVAAHGPEVRLLTANVFFGRASMAELVEIVKTERVDVLSLQEFTPDARSGLEEEGLRAQLPYEVVDPRWGAAGSGLYSRYPLTALPPLPGTVMAHPRAALELAGRKVEVTAVHPLPPIDPQGRADWKHSLSTLPTATSGGALNILAGDFNATLDHARFRGLLDRGGYTDAADRDGGGLKSTWGFSGFPRLTLDHILIPPSVAVRSYDVLRLSGSDHRPVLATLRLP